MKAIASNTSRQMLREIAQRLSLARILEGSLGAGVMTVDYKRAARQPGWTAEQLVVMSNALAQPLV